MAHNLEDKIENGLKNDNTEVKSIPTYIHPLSCGAEGQAVVLDWGGTNYRAAVINFAGGVANIHQRKPEALISRLIQQKVFDGRFLLPNNLNCK